MDLELLYIPMDSNMKDSFSMDKDTGKEPQQWILRFLVAYGKKASFLKELLQICRLN